MERTKKREQSKSSEETLDEFLDELVVLLKEANRLLYGEEMKVSD